MLPDASSYSTGSDKKSALDPPAFIHLGVRSPYSIAEGATRTENIVEFCQEHNLPAVGFTDTANLFGALHNATALQKNNIQPIIGMRLPFCLHDNEKQPHYIYLYPSSHKGYLNLIELATRIYTNAECNNFPAVLLKTVCLYAEDLIAHTGTSDGLLSRLINKNKIKEAQDFIEQLLTSFENNLYIAISRHSYAREQTAEPWLLHFAHQYKLPLLAFQDSLFYKPEHYKAQCILYHIQHKNIHLDDIELEMLSDQHFLKSPDVMAKLFSDLPEALENTQHFYKRIAFMPKPRDHVMPRYDRSISKDDEDTLLKQQASANLQKKFEQNLLHKSQQPMYQERLDFELKVIVNMGYAGYFLIVADFVNWAKNHSIAVGPGRGSGAGSLVAWMLGITTIDPIRWNLLFERFLNPDRISLPDFDIDFCPNGRDKVITYVAEKYGHERVAQIVTFGKLRARAAVQDVGRAIGRPYSEIEQISKLLPQLDAGGKSIPLKEAMTRSSELVQRLKEESDLKEWFALALGIEDLCRNVSTHAGGVVISDEPLKQILPLYSDTKSLLHITQFDMGDAEKAGLVKFDFLGLSTLTIIEDTVAIANKRHGLSLTADNLPLDDTKTFEHISTGETFGLFQIESPGMREAIVKLQPSNLGEVTALVALYRPGPMEHIPSFIDCKHGRKDITYLFPQLKDSLEETYGIVVYQEQVIKIAQSFAGFTLAKADVLRRAMGKKEAAVMEGLKQEFIESAIQHSNVSLEEATEMFAVIEKFSNYGFNKSHSVGYAIICYQTAYLKTHFPVEFFVSSMNNDIRNTDRLQKYLEPLRLNHIRLLPPDINRSQALFCIEEFEGKDAIRFGLGVLKNISPDAMQKLVDLRGNRPFSSVEDFARRISPDVASKRTLGHIFASGAFDSLGYHRMSLLNNLEDIVNFIKTTSDEEASNQGNLFAGDTVYTTKLVPKIEESTTPPPNDTSLGELERAALGFYLSQHPLLPLRGFLKNTGFVFSHDLQNTASGEAKTIRIVGELIKYKQIKGKNNGNFILFLEDMTGAIEVFLRSALYHELENSLRSLSNALLCIEATLEIRSDRLSVSARSITLLNDYLKHINRPLNISFDMQAANVVKSLESLKLCCLPEGNEDGEEIPIYLTLQNASANGELPMVDTKFSTKVSKDRLQALSAIEGVESIAFYNR